MDQKTSLIIKKYSPMWTNKQVWEFEQINEELTFDAEYLQPGDTKVSMKSKSSHQNVDIRETMVNTFDYLLDGYELWITNSKNNQHASEIYLPYLMAVIVDTMTNEEVCLKFREDNNYLVVSINIQADVIDCKEFFEEFYHLATGFNYDINTGIPEDETEAEIYLTRLQEEFDEKMMNMLGAIYISGNNDPDSIKTK
ncbi:MAG: hypothetical protein CK527_04150 [Nitrosarchaeum sp.]|nr:hypothetical protein [Nitrosarchaeum sp.]PHY09118.1 MAG: hypothetical protein CK527_04150 [Nitrosarchaeum sp.]